MITNCGFSSLFHWANGLTPVQHHNASRLTMINTVPGCEVFLLMLANDAHVGAISLITTTVIPLVGPSPLHCPSHSTTPGEWVLVGWRLDWVDDSAGFKVGLFWNVECTFLWSGSAFIIRWMVSSVIPIYPRYGNCPLGILSPSHRTWACPVARCPVFDPFCD